MKKKRGKFGWKVLGILILVVLLSSAAWQLTRPVYPLSMEETLAELTRQGQMVSVQDLSSLLERPREDVRLIDLRSPAAFEMGHLEGAINIPPAQLLDKENRKIFQDPSVTCVLYGQTQAEANGSWMLLVQLGYTNVKIMEGGYGYLEAIRDSLPEASRYLAEKARYNYVAVLKAATDEEKKALEARPLPPPPVVKKTIVPKAKPKPSAVVEEEEGC